MIKLRRPLPLLTIFAIGLSLGIALVILPLASAYSKAAVAAQDQYGEALSKAAARETAEAAFRQDLISLSAIIESVANNPEVLQAAVHNVEGRVLVQAGKEAHQLPNEQNTFQATISMQDSIAGVVTLTLAPTDWKSSIYLPLYISIIVCCLVYVIWSLYHFKLFVFEARPQSTANEEEHENQEGLDKTHESDRSDEQTDSERSVEPELKNTLAHASLCVKNVGALQQQLNAEIFRTTFQQLEQKLNKIGQLYGATECHWENDRYYIEFSAAQAHLVLFNAACAARLMLDLAGITNRIPLDLSAQISLTKDNILSDTMPFVGLAVHESAAAYSLLEDRVELLDLQEENGPRRLISKFYKPYSELLQKQTSQLIEQF